MVSEDLLDWRTTPCSHVLQRKIRYRQYLHHHSAVLFKGTVHRRYPPTTQSWISRPKTTDPALITKGTNAAAMRQVLGVKYPIPTPSSSVHLFDVAMLHVRALDPKIPGGQKFFASSEGPRGCTWADSIDIVKKHFPDEVAKGIFPLGGSIITKPILVDSSYTEKTFGFKFRSYEEQVTSVAGHYAELVAKNGGNNVDHSLASWTSWSKK